VPASPPLTEISFQPFVYVVGREKIREYARAVGETNPLYHDVAAARAAGYADLVAPPMFVVVYAAAAFEAAMSEPALQIDFAMLLHSGQEFEWGELVVAGDEVTTEIALAEDRERVGMRFVAFDSTSRNQRGARVCSGRWTVVVRPRA